MYQIYVGILMIAIYSGLDSISSASDRELDTLVLNDVTYSVNTCILDEYWNEERPRPKFRVVDSFSREYKAMWVVKDNKVHLTRFSAFDYRTGKSLTVTDIFPEEDKRFASWFTGTILAVKGTLSSGSFDHTFPELECIFVKNGIVMKVKTMKDKSFQIPGRVGLEIEKANDSMIIRGIAKNSPASRPQRFHIGNKLVFMKSDDWGKIVFSKQSISEVYGYLEGVDGTHLIIGVTKDGGDTVEEIQVERKSHFQ